MSPALVLGPDAPPDLDQEAFDVLQSAAEGHTGRIPPSLVARHILRVTRDADFSLRQAALEALLRRVKAAKAASDSWRLETALRGRMPVGLHRIAVTKHTAYPTLILSFAELNGSCGCADFARSSLGLCKHLWWLMEKGFDPKGNAREGTLASPPLSWDPVRPLTGLGDWLEGVCFCSPELPVELSGYFEARESPRRIRAQFIGNRGKRLELVRSLRSWIGKERISDRTRLRADPALINLLEREAAALALKSEMTPSEKELRQALAGLRRPLFPYQEEGVARFLSAGKLLLADDMGLGKTAQAIASCHVLYSTGRVKRGLVIVPAALKTQWLREWQLFSRVPCAIVDGLPETRTRQYRELKSGYLIMNYEQVLKDLPQLQKLAPEMVVLDEAQRIKNWATKTSLYVKQLQPAWRLVLSGTPLENRLAELASLMDWVDDLALEPKWRLSEWHTIRADGAREIVGARNLDTLRARLEPSSLRRIRKEVLRQLPPRSNIHVPVALTEEQQAAHAELDQPIAQLIRTSTRRPLTPAEFLKLMSLMTQQRIICNGLAQRDFEESWPTLQQARPTEATLRGLFSPKLSELRELISSLVVTQGRKVVVFSQWKRMLRLAEWAVSDILSGSHLRAVYFTGDESQKRRTQNIVDFHDDNQTRVFFATDAGGVGLNLQRAASACVHLDLPWNPAVLEQRSGRIYRLGQRRPVEIFALVSSSGIESRIASIVSDKKALFDGLFDGSSDQVRFEKGGSFMSTLQKVLEPLPTPSVPASPNYKDDKEELDNEDNGEIAESEGDVSDTMTEAADSGSADGAGAATPPPTPPTPAFDLMAGINVQRRSDGRLVLEARPEAAAAFAAMLEGVAALLKQFAPPIPAPPKGR